MAGNFRPHPLKKLTKTPESISARREDISEDADWPPNAVSMHEETTEEIKHNKKIIKKIQTFKMADGTTMKKELKEVMKI